MNFSFITSITNYINELMKNYPSVFHGLVPIGTILSAILGMMNTRHLKTQANIQREIENSRYKIDLFNHRNKAYQEFLETQFQSEFRQVGERNLSSAIIYKINQSLEKTRQCRLVFGSKDKNSPLLSLENIIISIIDKEQYKNDIMSIIPHTTDTEEEKETKEHIERKIENIFHDLKKHSSLYNIYRERSSEYMMEKLEVPEQAFLQKASISRIAIDYLFFSRSEHQRKIILSILSILLLSLGAYITLKATHTN